MLADPGDAAPAWGCSVAVAQDAADQAELGSLGRPLGLFTLGVCAKLACRLVDEECLGVARLSNRGKVRLSCLRAVNEACEEARLGWLGLLGVLGTLARAAPDLDLPQSLKLPDALPPAKARVGVVA